MKKIILYLFFCVLQKNFLLAQDNMLNIFDELISTYEEYASKWPHPDSNESLPLSPCASDISPDDRIEIANFNPINRVVEVAEPPFGENYANNINVSRRPYEEYGDIDATNENKIYEINYNHEHLIIPNRNAKNNEFFEFNFTLTNKTSLDKLYYVVFYQNETYKYSENDNNSEWNVLLSGDNYYGSWGYDEKSQPGLRSIAINSNQSKEVSGIFRIRGNPRNDAKFVPNGWDWDDTNENDWVMNRWGYPPRMGNYRFLLVVTSNPNDIQLEFLKDASGQHNGKHYSPFYWRNLANSNYAATTAVAEGCYSLKIYAKPDLAATLNDKIDVDPNNPLDSKHSPFTNNSFNNWTDEDFMSKNIPLFMDIEDYTQTDYNWNKHFFEDAELIETRIDYFDESNIDWDSGEVGNAYPENGEIIIANPPSDCKECIDSKDNSWGGVFPNKTYPYDQCKREHAGINYMGQKYGKFTAKIKFPKMFNQHKVWKGINNTFWFSRAYGEAWNSHSCSYDHIMAHNEFDIEYFAVSKKFTNYFDSGVTNNTANTTKQYDLSWEDKGEENGTPVIQFSNFDYKCDNVIDYIDIGQSIIIPYNENGENYNFCVSRGGESLQSKLLLPLCAALAEEIPSYDCGSSCWGEGATIFSDDDIFGVQYYYYQIEWRPSEIIFRMGQELDDLMVTAYFNANHTVIPKNVMTAIIAQHQLHIPLPGYFKRDGSINTEDFPHAHQLLPLSPTPIIGKVLYFSIE